ncbi:hypothetical protein ACQEVG_10800 [Streptomyces sp. CA-135486]|uniref:hypothetical protein n=1 Tax=Streptomyces sp. CA-135486 TaxID=3240049 RepID=UPI003D90CD10
MPGPQVQGPQVHGSQVQGQEIPEQEIRAPEAQEAHGAQEAHEVHAPGPQAYEPAAPAPIGVPRVPTGNADVDARLERLADADHLPADGHLEVYEDVHRGLRDALTALDARPAPAPQGPSPSPPYNYRS